MRTLACSTPRAKSAAIPREFTWLKHLNTHEQAKFFAGLLAQAVTWIKNDNWSSVVEWIEEWKATANVYAVAQVARGVRQGRQELVWRAQLKL